jgi:hypothetical protein
VALPLQQQQTLESASENEIQKILKIILKIYLIL